MLTQNRKYRSTTEIFHDILRVAGNEGYDGAGKTQIMYNAFLSYKTVKEYLTLLIGNGLLKHDIGNQKFKITEKGLRLLQLCDQINDLIRKKKKSDGKGIEDDYFYRDC